MRWYWLLFAAGCSFEGQSAGGPSPIDAADPGGTADGDDRIGDVAHVPSAVEEAFAATATLTIGSPAVIDTGGAESAPSIDMTLPDGASLVVSAQDGGGPELALLLVDTLVVDATLRVRGRRPLVVVAKTAITVGGVIDASADRGTPGPNGKGPRDGLGKGGDGRTGSNFNDGGAGGGGFGGRGGDGQISGDSGSGMGGQPYGTPELAVLEGGSGGGDMSPPGHCQNRPAGAGGGAIQLYARGTITITGSVRANGGGGSGAGSATFGLCNGWSVSATGGGSGGAIYVQAATVAGTGALLAQGGGGGGGSNYDQSKGGMDGANGPTTIAAAAGGTGAGGASGASNDGGRGGFRDAAPPSLATLNGTYDTGGGGGGGVGRIVVRAGTSTVVSSPTAVVLQPAP